MIALGELFQAGNKLPDALFEDVLISRWSNRLLESCGKHGRLRAACGDGLLIS